MAEASAQTFEFVRAGNAALHPGQSAKILCDGKQVGLCGALHPALEKKLDLDQPVFVFELDLDLISDKKLPAYSKISPLPSIRRDLALLLDQDVDYARVSDTLEKLANKVIPEFTDFMIFDVYSGENLDSGQKSLALGLIFQDFSRTLEEQEINGYVEKIMANLAQETGAVLR